VAASYTLLIEKCFLGVVAEFQVAHPQRVLEAMSSNTSAARPLCSTLLNFWLLASLWPPKSNALSFARNGNGSL
jgi:hypothetical protein